MLSNIWDNIIWELWYLIQKDYSRMEAFIIISLSQIIIQCIIYII